MYIPSSIILEVSSLCNVSCLGCALHGQEGFVNRPFGNMKKEIWEPVIREMGSWDKKILLSAHGGGEPLMHPDFRNILTFATSFPNIEVGFLTNGMLLDQSWSEFILDAGLEWVAFSIDGVVSETHDKVRQNSDFVKVEKNLEMLLSMKKKKQNKTPWIKLNMVAYDLILDQKDAFVEKWINKVDEVMVSHYRNPPASKRWPGVTQKNRKPCPLLWSQAVVAWDGRLGLCCEDFNIDYSSGRLGNDADLLELWNSSYINAVRELHSKGQFEEHPMCRVCDTWAESHITETVDEKCGYRIRHSPAQKVFTLLKTD